MADKITLEDYNTWQYLFNNINKMLNIPKTIKAGDDAGVYKVLSKPSYYNVQVNIDYFTRDGGNSTGLISKENGHITVLGISNVSSHIFVLQSVDFGDEGIYIPLNNDLRLTSESDGFLYPIFPKYNKYYLFNEDNGDKRKYYLNTLYDTLKINNKEDMQIDDEGNKYCKLSTVINDNKLTNQQNHGYYLSDWKISLYEPPLITIEEPLYIGCNNNLSSKFNSPITFETFVNNKKYTTYPVPVSFKNDYLLVNVKSKSEYPYLPLNKKFQVPVEYKFAENNSDLTKYEYIKLKKDMVTFDLTFEGFDNTIDLNKHILLNGVVTNNKKTTFKAGTIQSCIIVNNDNFTFEDITFNGNANKIVNNGTLTINKCLINKLNIINNGELNIINSELDLSATRQDLPFIHNISEYNIENNNINVTGAFKDNNIIFIRGLNDANTLLNNNTWSYDVEYTEEETIYNITGNGFIYSNIDEDTIILKNLEVSNV